MSLESWEEEFYPEPAWAASTNDKKALQHSLRKWNGLTAANLAKHDIVKFSNNFVGEPDKVLLPIDCSSCALCVKYKGSHAFARPDCHRCPLSEVRRGRACDQSDGGDLAPYASFTGKSDPRPMIQLIQDAIVALPTE